MNERKRRLPEILVFVLLAVLINLLVGRVTVVRDVKASQTTQDGRLTLDSNAILGTTAWEDLRVPLSTASILGLAGDADYDVFLGATRAYTFQTAADENVYFSVQLPHSYKHGTNLRPHVHWAPSDANAGDVTWCLEYTLAELEGTFPGTTTICVTDATETTAHKHQIASFAEIDGSAIDSVSAMINCRLYRDVDNGDDYGSDAFALEIDFHYEVDSFGSRTEFTK